MKITPKILVLAAVSVLYAQQGDSTVTIGSVPAIMRSNRSPTRPSIKVGEVPPGAVVHYSKSRRRGRSLYYYIEYNSKSGWISSFNLATGPLGQQNQYVDTVKIQESPICQMLGVNGLQFGMTFDEARAIDLDWDYPSLSDYLKGVGISEEEYDSINKRDFTDADLLLLLSMHDDSFAGVPAEGVIHFLDGELATIIYKLKLKTSNKNNYIEQYFDFKELLAKKYGAPAKSSEILEGRYRDESPHGDYAGTAISLGYGEYLSAWRCMVANTMVVLRLSGDNSVISLSLAYMDLERRPTSRAETHILDDF